MLIFNKLDKYILKKFLTVLLFTVSGWILLFIIIDMVEHLDDFLNNHASFWQITNYYLMYIPFSAILTMPISVLIASLFSVGTLAQNNEIVAMQSSGISLYRIMAWLLISGLMISILVGLSGETFVPGLNRKRLDYLRYEIKKKARLDEKNRSNIVLKDSENIIVTIGFYNGKNKAARNVSILWLNKDKNIEKRLDAATMTWNKQEKNWKLKKVVERTFNQGEIVKNYDEIVFQPQYLLPKDLLDLRIKQEEMSFMELYRFIKRIKSMGLSPHKWITDINMKVSYPLANFIVLLIGAPLAARKRRSGVAMGMIIAFVVSFIYFIFVRIGQVLGHKGVLDPVVAAWMGDTVFLVVGMVIILKVRK